MERWISIIGMLTLLGIAWLMSNYKKVIQWRTILWGMGLQLLFAVIILQRNIWSLGGMAILGMLISVFFFRERIQSAANRWMSVTLIIATLLGCGILAYFLSALLPVRYIILAVLVMLILNAKGRWFPQWQNRLASLFVILLFAALIQNRLYGRDLFQRFSDAVAGFLSLASYGAAFLFGNLADTKYFFPNSSVWPGFGYQFAFVVLPTIIFFGAFMAILYHMGIMQRVIAALAKFMQWTLGTSGAETMSCSANIFVGQTEAPLLIKPYLNEMTRSELLTIMVGGFATIAGGVLAGYIAMGVPAGHLIAASVMSAPAALVIGKIIYPELEHSKTAGDVQIPEIQQADNLLEAASNGITDGLKLAVNVGAMLIGFIALIAVIDVILSAMDTWIDGRLLHGQLIHYAENSGLSPVTQEYSGYFPGSLKTLFGTLLRPLAWVMGVPWNEADKVGNLLGIKLSLNEFVAYGNLGLSIQNGLLSDRAQIIATYALCGFANFSSIGIQLGGIGAIAPKRRKDLSKIVLKAMFGGALASWTTATIAGILI